MASMEGSHMIMDNVTLSNSSQFNTTIQEHEHEHEGIHLIGWIFDYVAHPLLISVFLIVAAMLKIVFHYAHFLSSVVPESCLLIIVGVLFQGFLKIFDLHALFTLEPRVFMLFLLPPIILDASYSLNDRAFSDNLGTILLYAVVGTMVNFVLLAPTLYGLWKFNAMGTILVDGEAYEFSMSESFLFASFIVAVDPVAVLAIFDEVGVNAALYFLVFGESLLNDAVTIVLNEMMVVFVRMDVIPWNQVVLGIISFFTVSLGGLAVGILCGIITCLITRVTHYARVVEPLTLLVMAFISYLVGDLLHWSGLISMIGCGLIQAQYAFHNISRKSYITVKYFTKMMSAVCDAMIFMFLGEEMLRDDHVWHTGFTFSALFYCIIFRFVSVYGLTKLANRVRIRKINYQEQFVMWYGGLRGAVCFALCSTLSGDLPLKNMFLTTTLVIIFFTVFIQGSSIKPLVKLFKIARKSDEPTSMMEATTDRVIDHLMTGLESIGETPGTNSLKASITEVDSNYIRPFLQKDPLTRDQQILEVYCKAALKDYERIMQEKYTTLAYNDPIGQQGDVESIEGLDEEDSLLTGGMSLPEEDQDLNNTRHRPSRKRTTSEGNAIPTTRAVMDLLDTSKPSTILRPRSVGDDDLLRQLHQSHILRAQLSRSNNAFRRRSSVYSQGVSPAHSQDVGSQTLATVSEVKNNVIGSGQRRATVSGADLEGSERFLPHSPASKEKKEDADTKGRYVTVTVTEDENEDEDIQTRDVMEFLSLKEVDETAV